MALFSNGHQKTVLVLPGVEVVRCPVTGSSFYMFSAGRFTKCVKDFRYETGSRLSTALAAGLAPIIIYCINANDMNMNIINPNKGPIVGIVNGDNDTSFCAAKVIE